MNGQYYRKAKSQFRIPGVLKKVAGNKALMLTILFAFPALSFIMFSNKGVVKRLSLASEKKMIQQEVQDAQSEQIRLQRLSKGLDRDPQAIEKVAREKFFMVRENETVYKVKKDQ